MIPSSKSVLCSALVLALQPAYSAPDEARVLAAMRTTYPGTVVDRVTRTPMPGVYEVWMGGNVAFVSASDLRYMVFGRLVDLKSMRDLTASKLRDAQGASVASATSSTQSEKYKGPMPISDAITVVRGDGSRVISVFTDPACGYCRQLETQLRRLNNVTIHYYLLPFQGSEAPMAIWCAKDRAAAYAAAMADTVPQEAAVACAHPLDRNRLLAATLRIQATPTLLFSDGALVPGVMAVEEIESRLNAGAVKTVTHQGRIHAKPTFE